MQFPQLGSHNYEEPYDPYWGYSSDDSGVINNINDDVMKMVERLVGVLSAEASDLSHGVLLAFMRG